jgi:hypothetical protein
VVFTRTDAVNARPLDHVNPALVPVAGMQRGPKRAAMMLQLGCIDAVCRQ